MIKRLSSGYYVRFTVSAAVPCTLYRTNSKGASALVAGIADNGELGQYLVCPADLMLEWLTVWNDYRTLKATQAATPPCRGCGAGINTDPSCGLADGCPCNSPRGINHGLVPVNVCTCDVCDPAKTGAVRTILANSENNSST